MLVEMVNKQRYRINWPLYLQMISLTPMSELKINVNKKYKEYIFISYSYNYVVSYTSLECYPFMIL